MEQLKGILQIVKKHHFWLLCVACVVGGFIAWKMAAGKLSGEFNSRKGTIAGKFQSLDQIRQTENFPNADWEPKARELVNQQKTEVRTAWQSVYDEQAKVLNWPDYLGENFRSILQSPTAAEQLPQPYPDKTRYMARISDEFPKLLSIVGAEAFNEEKKASDIELKADTAAATNVRWDDESQKKIFDSLQAEDNLTNLKVWLTQEDLWVYQVLLTIVKNMNENRYVPVVKEINELLIAQEAAKRFEAGLASGIIEKPKVATTTPDGGVGGGAAEPPSYASPVDAQAEPPPDEGRYIDAEGKALQPADQWRSQPFKRMPIFIRLTIDQREITKLMVECANAPLPVEIRQLRINPREGKGGSSSGGRPEGLPAETTVDRAVYDVPVEISGVISIYNPPDAARLGIEAPAGEAPAGVPGG
jgi:hypothetical protein